MNVRELNDEQAEQLGKTLRAWDRWTEFFLVNQCKDDAEVDAFEETRALQEMLQPPKQYLVVGKLGHFEYLPQTMHQLHMRGFADQNLIKALYEWQDGVGTVGEPITGEPLKELLEGDS